MTTSLGTKDRVSFGSGGGLSVAMIFTGVILLVFSGIVVGVVIATDYWEKGMGPPLIFVVGLALAALIAGVVPMIRRRRVVDFMAGEIRTSTERVPLWQVRSVTISSRLVEVPLSGIRRSGSRLVTGSPVGMQEWQLGVVANESETEVEGVDTILAAELLVSGQPIALKKSSDHLRLMREAHDLARRLEVPMVDTTDPHCPVIVAAGEGTPPAEMTATANDPPPLLEDVPESIRATIEGDCVVVRTTGFEVVVAIGLAIVALISLLFFFADSGWLVIPPWSEIGFESRLAGVSGLVLALAALVFLVLVVGGHHRKTLRAGPGGIQRSTDFRWSRAVTISLADIVDIQKIAISNASGRSTSTNHYVVVISEEQSIRHGCDNEEAANWLQGQLRALVKHFRPA